MRSFKTHGFESVGAVQTNDDVKVLKRILSYARSIDIPCSDPKIQRLPERKTKGRVTVCTAKEVGKLYAAFASKGPALLPITIAMCNGMRKCPDPFLLATVLGHSHTRVTEVCSHLRPDHLEGAVVLPASLEVCETVTEKKKADYLVK